MRVCGKYLLLQRYDRKRAELRETEKCSSGNMSVFQRHLILSLLCKGTELQMSCFENATKTAAAEIVSACLCYITRKRPRESGRGNIVFGIQARASMSLVSRLDLNEMKWERGKKKKKTTEDFVVTIAAPVDMPDAYTTNRSLYSH